MTFALQLAEVMPIRRNHLWDLSLQLGIEHAVTGIPTGPDLPPAWDFDYLLGITQRFADAGLKLAVIESAPASIQEPLKLGIGDFDEHVDHFCQLIDNMGRLGIPVICHNWMAGLGWLRTSLSVPWRGGSLVSGYDHAVLANAPLTEWGEVTEDALWERMTRFLRRVVPVAEHAGVKLAVHPDDPPLSPIRGIGRILTSPGNFQRVLDIYPSPNNGLTFCQGNFSAMGCDVPATIRHFGNQNAIHFVHFRDVKGTAGNFVETFQDDGQTDMIEAVRAYRDAGFGGPVRVDHVPTMVGEDNSNPGYETMGRLYALGYIRGIVEAVAREDAAVRA